MTVPLTSSYSSGFYEKDETSKKKLVDDVRQSCLHNGFFQIVGHRIPLDLQMEVLACVKSFFSLSQAEKERVHKGHGGYHLLQSDADPRI